VSEQQRGEPRPDDPFADAPEAAPDDRESAYVLLQRGHELLRGRHFAQAAVVLERAAAAEPGKGSILEALGRAYFNSRQHERARETFARLLEVDPSAHYAHFALGESLRRLGREREARTHLRLAAALEPRSPLYRAALRRAAPPEDPSAAGA
jgi:Flp pilus assembly protein TadD